MFQKKPLEGRTGLLSSHALQVSSGSDSAESRRSTSFQADCSSCTRSYAAVWYSTCEATVSSHSETHFL